MVAAMILNSSMIPSDLRIDQRASIRLARYIKSMPLPVKTQPPKPMTAKSSILHLFLAALVGGTVAFILSQLQFSLWIEPSTSKDSTQPVIEVAPDVVSPSVSPAPAPLSPQRPLANGLRIRNTSPYAIRVVLMAQADAQSNPTANPYRAPVHWDFAPHEGSKAGLLLSVPEGNLTLKPGDVLVAFALDGSRHYWGPYVVGKTRGLTQSAASEWQLVLNP